MKNKNKFETSRRRFLQGVGAATVASQVPAFARTFEVGQAVPAAIGANSEKSIVCIFLRGAADGLNMIVPYGDSSYEGHRPTLAMDLDDGLIRLDSTFALHPALAPLESLYKSKRFAPIVCAGSTHATRSHFDAQDWMEFAAPGNRTMREGWLNRYLMATKTESSATFRAVAIQELLPRSLRGTFPVLAVPGNATKNKSSKNLDIFERFYGDSGGMLEGGEMANMQPDNDAAGVVESGRMTIETLRRFQEIVGKAPTKRSGNATVSGSAYPSSRFSTGLQQIAKVLKAGEGLEVAGIDYNGWDDHIGEGGVEGKMATRMTDFAQCLAAFCSDLGPELDNTTIMVMTEFGRTVRENGNTGTDHGHGSAMFVIGGDVKGGKIHGDWTGLAKKDLYQGRDVPVTTDFRNVYYSVLKNHFGYKTPQEFFPDFRPQEMRSLY
ncbi:MAG TPA: DUF1501 domain-containing protein [Planctomycetes bacterium]|jgi:uncharacterized protein (DUF1501 family)|nr:DUF1501 domain-containing protein [Planctomycetota bacterium]